MSNSLGLVIESLVAILLLLTIAYCVQLNRQLNGLRADKISLKGMISELMAATTAAERAIAGLRQTVGDCDAGLGERLRNAERLTGQMDRQLRAGENLLSRLSRTVPPPALEPAEEIAALADPKAMVAAADAFASRARSLVSGRAA